MHSRVSTQRLLHLRSLRAAMLSVGSKDGGARLRHKFPSAAQISRDNRRGESFWRNSPAKRSTTRAAKIDYKLSESLNCRLPIAACRLTHKQNFGGTVGFLANYAPKFQFRKRSIRSFLQHKNPVELQQLWQTFVIQKLLSMAFAAVRLFIGRIRKN